MENYPWFKKLFSSLNLYYRLFKKIVTLVNDSEVSEKSKVTALRILLINAEEDLIEVERNILNFTADSAILSEDVCQCTSKFQAGPIRVTLYLN